MQIIVNVPLGETLVAIKERQREERKGEGSYGVCTTAILMYSYMYVQPTQKCEIEKGEKEEEDRDSYVPYIHVYNSRSINHSTASQTERKKRSSIFLMIQ